MKKYFLTGLVILLPLALTIVVVSFIFNLLTDPFVGIFRGVLAHFDLLEKSFLFWTPEQLQNYASKLLILVLLFFITIGLGALARWFFFRYFLGLWNYILHRIPIVRTIYKTFQDAISTLFNTQTNSFKQVVMVPFPNPLSYTIGLVTRDNLPDIKNTGSKNLVAVFVPTAPNPTSGFLMIFKEEEIVYLDMKVEDAFKYIISCGVILTPFKAIANQQAKDVGLSNEQNEKDKIFNPLEP